MPALAATSGNLYHNKLMLPCGPHCSKAHCVGHTVEMVGHDPHPPYGVRTPPPPGFRSSPSSGPQYPSVPWNERIGMHPRADLVNHIYNLISRVMCFSSDFPAQGRVVLILKVRTTFVFSRPC